MWFALLCEDCSMEYTNKFLTAVQSVISLALSLEKKTILSFGFRNADWKCKSLVIHCGRWRGGTWQWGSRCPHSVGHVFSLFGWSVLDLSRFISIYFLSYNTIHSHRVRWASFQPVAAVRAAASSRRQPPAEHYSSENSLVVLTAWRVLFRRKLRRVLRACS